MTIRLQCPHCNEFLEVKLGRPFFIMHLINFEIIECPICDKEIKMKINIEFDNGNKP